MATRQYDTQKIWCLKNMAAIQLIIDLKWPDAINCEYLKMLFVNIL